MRWLDTKNFRTNKLEGAEATCGIFRIKIHNWVGCDDIWFLTINGIFDRKELESQKLQDAKVEVQKIFVDCLTRAQSEVK